MRQLSLPAQRLQYGLLQIVAIEKIISVEGDNTAAVGVRDMHAGLLHGSDVEAPGINELHDENPEQVFITQAIGQRDFGQTTEQLPQRRGAGLRRVIRGKQLEQV